MNYFDPSAGLGPTPPGIGVQPVQPVGSPLGPPAAQQDPGVAKLIQALLARYGAQGQLNPAAFRAASLREDRPYYAQGGGALGVRTGEGPGGWAISLADAVNGIFGRKEQEKRDKVLEDALKEVQRTKGNFAGEVVTQGSPLSPLGL